jgi:hypothetical protein
LSSKERGDLGESGIQALLAIPFRTNICSNLNLMIFEKRNLLFCTEHLEKLNQLLDCV